MSDLDSTLAELAEYADSKLDMVIKTMLGELFLNRPDDPVNFMLDFLKEYEQGSYGRDPGLRRNTHILPTMQVEGPTQSARGGRRRVGISAESVSMKTLENTPHRVVPKSEEDREQIKEAVRNNFLFKSLEGDQIMIVLDAMERKTYSAGDDVIVQGDDGEDFFVGDGELECYLDLKDGKAARMVKHYGHGEAFGELALMYNTPRAASIRAKTDCTLWAMDRQTFQKVLLFTTAKKREKYEQFLGKVKILENLDKYERAKVADALLHKTYTDGEYIITAGDTEDTSFYIFVNGKAKATKVLVEGEEAVTVFEYTTPGLFFGELALINNNPRAANVIAVGECECVYLDRGAFTRLLGPCEDIIKRTEDVYANIEKEKLAGKSS